jgi:hypothetical protein
MYDGTCEEQVGEKLGFQHGRLDTERVVRTYAPGTRTRTFFPVNFEKLTLSSMSLILISTSGTLSPALMGEADARDAKAEWAVDAAAEMIDAEDMSCKFLCKA